MPSSVGVVEPDISEILKQIVCLVYREFIARRIQEIGVGCSLAPDAMADALASATTVLLREGSYRQAAQQIAHALQEAGAGEQNAAAEIEAICGR